jgi:mono/diheme cytochrome c family protein
MIALRLVAIVVFAVSSLPASAQDAVRGRQRAEQWCSSCHAVERRGSDSVPTLQQISNLPGRNANYLRTFLANPHPPMPPFQLARNDIDDLVAYIVSLGQP